MFRKMFFLLIGCASLLCIGFSQAAERTSSIPSTLIVQAKTYAYSGNVKSGKYHNASCQYFACKNCTARFKTAAQAKARGFVACRVCGG